MVPWVSVEAGTKSSRQMAQVGCERGVGRYDDVDLGNVREGWVLGEGDDGRLVLPSPNFAAVVAIEASRTAVLPGRVTTGAPEP